MGQIYAFVNDNVRDQFLGGDDVPKYEGEFAGYRKATLDFAALAALLR